MDSIMERPTKAVCASCKHVSRGSKKDPRDWKCKVGTTTTEDPVTGNTVRVFTPAHACLRRNAHGNCKQYEPTRLIRFLRKIQRK